MSGVAGNPASRRLSNRASIAIGPARLEPEGAPPPKMLEVLKSAGADSFYRNDGTEFLSRDGAYRAVPGE